MANLIRLWENPLLLQVLWQVDPFLQGTWCLSGPKGWLLCSLEIPVAHHN